jgi:hypothetical protein
MTIKPLSPRELRVWHAFMLMGEDVLGRIGRDIAQATGLSGPEFGTGDVIIESGEDSERSPRQRTLRRPLPRQSLF